MPPFQNIKKPIERMCMCVYICVLCFSMYICVCIYVNVFACVLSVIRLSGFLSVIRGSITVCVCMYVCLYTCMLMHACLCVKLVYLFVYVSAYVCGICSKEKVAKILLDQI